MFGSARQPRLTEDRDFIWRADANGVNAQSALAEMAAALSAYQGDKSQVLLGYWEYGVELVLSAPSTPQQKIE